LLENQARRQKRLTMRDKEIALLAIGVICVAVFAWSLTIMCSRPTIAHAANWLSTVAFALLGPLWALQVASPATSSRMIAGFSTVVIGFFGALIAPPFEFACH
jgi:predicted membrane protein